MKLNSETQTLNILKANPGLCGEQIGARCVPDIQVNTVIKNICHIREKYGKACIRMQLVKGKNDGVEFATYYWMGTAATEDEREYIKNSRSIIATYPVDHPDRIKEEAYLDSLEGSK